MVALRTVRARITVQDGQIKAGMSLLGKARRSVDSTATAVTGSRSKLSAALTAARSKPQIGTLDCSIALQSLHQVLKAAKQSEQQLVQAGNDLSQKARVMQELGNLEGTLVRRLDARDAAVQQEEFDGLAAILPSLSERTGDVTGFDTTTGSGRSSSNAQDSSFPPGEIIPVSRCDVRSTSESIPIEPPRPLPIPESKELSLWSQGSTHGIDIAVSLGEQPVVVTVSMASGGAVDVGVMTSDDSTRRRLKQELGRALALRATKQKGGRDGEL